MTLLIAFALAGVTARIVRDIPELSVVVWILAALGGVAMVVIGAGI